MWILYANIQIHAKDTVFYSCKKLDYMEKIEMRSLETRDNWVQTSVLLPEYDIWNWENAKKAPKNSVEKSPCLTSVSVADREAISSRAKVDDSKHSNGEKNTAERNGLITISQVNNNVVRVERFGLWLYTCKQIGTICIRFPLVSLCDFHPVCASALFEHTLHGNTPKAKTLGKSA